MLERGELAQGRVTRDLQLVQQRLGLLQVRRIKSLGELAIDRDEKIVGLLSFALIALQPRHAHRRAQFPRLCLLLTRNRERTLEISLCFRRIQVGRYQRNFSGNTMDLRFAPSFRHVL